MIELIKNNWKYLENKESINYNKNIAEQIIKNLNKENLITIT
jgi:hypothetical protein